MRIRELEDELFRARQTVFHLMPPRAREILDGMYLLETPRDVYDWFEGAMKQVLELAEPFLAEDRRTGKSLGHRARCPLCGESSNDRYNPDNGFAFPEGLLRHLLGERKANQCGVAREVLAEARRVSTHMAGKWLSGPDV
jgi:hypothetical protein